MEFGLQMGGDYAAVLAAARWAEECGLACFALADHYLASADGARSGRPAYDAFAIAAGLARETSRIRLSVLVAPITFRHPAVLGKNAVTIDEMSGGRFTLGVGTGWLAAEHEVFGIPFPPRSERFVRMEEALGYLRAMFTERAEAFEGTHYRLQSVAVAPVPSPGLQLVVGGTGPAKTPRLAGRYADEYNVYPAGREEMTRRIDLAKQAAAEAGRDPDALLLSSSGLLVVGTDEADYRRRLAAVADALGRDVDDLEEHFNQRNTPRGSAAQVQETLGMMADIGIARFYVQSLGQEAVIPVAETFELIGA